LDFGCGYGALFGFLLNNGYTVDYRGFDISEAMLHQAAQLYGDHHNCTLVSDPSLLTPADYVVASGILNVKLNSSHTEWETYCLATLQRLHSLSKYGFAFNVLTKYSDEDRKRVDLYYADPCTIFDYCKKQFSRNVALLHDYDLYEFTVIVRKPH
jgi:hypothetical protein